MFNSYLIGRVQNAEVQLDCHQVWIGSLRVKVVTKVRIKADNNAGFHFNILYKCECLYFYNRYNYVGDFFSVRKVFGPIPQPKSRRGSRLFQH